MGKKRGILFGLVDFTAEPFPQKRGKKGTTRQLRHCKNNRQETPGAPAGSGEGESGAFPPLCSSLGASKVAAIPLAPTKTQPQTSKAGLRTENHEPSTVHPNQNLPNPKPEHMLFIQGTSKHAATSATSALPPIVDLGVQPPLTKIAKSW